MKLSIIITAIVATPALAAAVGSVWQKSKQRASKPASDLKQFPTLQPLFNTAAKQGQSMEGIDRDIAKAGAAIDNLVDSAFDTVLGEQDKLNEKRAKNDQYYPLEDDSEYPLEKINVDVDPEVSAECMNLCTLTKESQCEEFLSTLLYDSWTCTAGTIRGDCQSNCIWKDDAIKKDAAVLGP
ncbi:hypothetical protein CC80DRAFT_595852 [Byssothecium circinans]|uniref:Extracellular membrane protein CFEM domain-containing protein n=1 Tax=Byssothecium circinans TaxID=147558 RepID=A0A6A5TNH3_9PLEO|nr:hypothetical protein CC80DRAFT_595852 [Byssothecium circinans]